MSAGSIIVDLLIRTGSFETDIDRASKTAKKRAKEIDDALKAMGSTIAAAFVATAGALALLTKQAIDGIDALNDVADATGASIENISALEQVALQTGSSLETVSSVLVKFNNVLKEAEPDSAMAQALKAIGLNAEELRRLDPAEALRVTAVALSKFADDGNKARLTQELFGKSIKEAAPLLKDLADKTELVGTVTKDQAQAAEDFNKSIFGLQATVNLLVREFTIGLVPALQDVSKWVNDLSKDEDALSGITSTLNTALNVTVGIFKGIALVGANVIYVFEGIGREIGAIAAQLVALARFDLGAFSAISDAVKADALKARKEIDALNARILGGSTPAAPAGVPVPSAGLPTVGKLPNLEAAKKARAETDKELKKQQAEDAKFAQDAIDVYIKSLEEQGEATNRLIVENHKAAESYKDILDPTRAVSREIKQIQALVESGALTPDEGLALEVKKLEDVYGGAKDKLTELDEFSKSAARNIQSSFADFLFDPFAEGLDGMAKGFLDILRRMAAEAAAAQLSSALFGGQQKGDTGILGGIFPAIFGGFRAAGGPVSGGSSYIVGERGPELFTPNTSGAITPNSALGGSVSVSVSVDASGSNVQGDSTNANQLGNMIGSAVMGILVQQKRPGGLLA